MYEELISKMGADNQIVKAIEEMHELEEALIQNILHGTVDAEEMATEEMADVEIMLEQLKEIFDNATAVAKEKEYKLKRTEERYGVKIRGNDKELKNDSKAN